MGPFITAAIATAAFVKGAFVGAVVGAAAVACACACRRARSRGALDHAETAEPQEG